MLKFAGLFLIIIYLSFFNSSVLASSQVVINEFLAHASSENKEWVEFYNPDGVDLSAYWLDDDVDFASDSGSSAKKSLASLNTGDPKHPFLEFESFLNNGGDYVVLFAADGVIVDEYQYTSDPGVDVTIGRSPDGSGGIGVLASATKGSANSSPLPSVSPTPVSTPFPSSSPNPSPAKSPSPVPKSTPVTVAKIPSASQNVSSVLGEADRSIDPSPAGDSITTIQSPTPLASPMAEVLSNQSSSKVKVAAILTGSGVILIGLSIGFFLWYKRVLGQEKAGKDKDQLDKKQL